MTTTYDATPLLVRRVEQSTVRDTNHHVTIPATSTNTLSSLLPAWNSSTPKTNSLKFRNPWPSWRTPTRAEVWEHLQWGEDDDPSIQLATGHLPRDSPSQPPEKQHRPTFSDINNWPDSNGAKAARLLEIQDPDFSFDTSSADTKAKVTWLGHASMLVQLPPLGDEENARPVRCLFDPIFSMRCSPSQVTGPIRSYPPPCGVEALPIIDAVFISHNHYDHLDHDTVKTLWNKNKDTIRFFVPLGNRRFFLESGIHEDHVIEMDWWDSVHLAPQTGSTGTGELRISCTPAQHNSGRIGYDANSTLWSSWYLEYSHPKRSPYRVFFAGDTGYQFHKSTAWPFNIREEDTPSLRGSEDESPACPAFEEIRDRLGPPDLLLMPVWVGATFTYLRSFSPLPDWINPFPRHSPGLTAANHMPPWDAVKVVKLMTKQDVESPPTEAEPEIQETQKRKYQPIAIAIHWGTFVTDPIEVFKTLGQLEWACDKQGVRFVRSLPVLRQGERTETEGSKTKVDRKSNEQPYFLAMNQGQSVYI